MDMWLERVVDFRKFTAMNICQRQRFGKMPQPRFRADGTRDRKRLSGFSACDDISCLRHQLRGMSTFSSGFAATTALMIPIILPLNS
jgi:hypothetical protein